jgi:hypothetical protein
VSLGDGHPAKGSTFDVGCDHAAAAKRVGERFSPRRIAADAAFHSVPGKFGIEGQSYERLLWHPL